MIGHRQYDERQATLAQAVLDAGALVIDEARATRFASGLLSPCFFDSSVFQYEFTHRRLVVNALRRRHTEMCRRLGLRYRALVPAAVAIGGIVFAAWLSPSHRIVTVRKCGNTNSARWKITGLSNPTDLRGVRVVVLEDVFTHGTSSLAVIGALREAGAVADYILAIAHYDFPDIPSVLEAAGVHLIRLVSIPELVTIGHNRGRFSDSGRATFLDWYKDPQGWSGRWWTSGRPIQER